MMNFKTLGRRLGLGLLGVALLGALVVVVLRSGPLAPVRVTVVRASEGSVVPALFGIGTVEARRTYLIGPTVAGRLRKVTVDVGDTVRAGQLLAEMDPVDLDDRVLALDASMARATAVVKAAQAQQQDAASKLELAATTARRYVDLGEQNFVSSGGVEAKLQERASADAGVAVAAANVVAARQDLQRLEAERAGLRQQRDNVRLLAPASGLVVSRDAEPGSTVVAGQAVLRLIDPASVWVKVRLDQGRSAGLTMGLAASIALRSAPGEPIAGRVVRVEMLSDSVTEERTALVAFDKLPAGVSVGELAEVTLQLPATRPALLLPNASIKHRGEQTGVWRVVAGEPVFVPVRTGLGSLQGQVQVLDGLKAGDTVVVYSERELDARSRIQVVDALVKVAP
jgi:HlyD family secretion protein